MMSLIKAYNLKLKDLKPTCNEIRGYARLLIVKGIANGRVKTAYDKKYYDPRIHSPTSKDPRFKPKPHIDIGCDGVHLSLDLKATEHFITYIERRRRKG